MKTALENSDFESFWHRLYFDLNNGYINAAIKRAYRDFNRTIENMPKDETVRGLLRKNWVKELQSNLELLLTKEFLSQKEFDDWHESLCNKLCQKNKELILTIGQSQKWINMSLKYLFLIGEKYVHGISKNYQFFHIPIDSIVQKVMENKYQIPKFSMAWSKLNSYNNYLNYQKKIRQIFANKIPMDEEFKLFNEAYLGSPHADISR